MTTVYYPQTRANEKRTVSYKGTTGNSGDRGSKGNGYEKKRRSRLPRSNQPSPGEFGVIRLKPDVAVPPNLTAKPQQKAQEHEK